MTEFTTERSEMESKIEHKDETISPPGEPPPGEGFARRSLPDAHALVEAVLARSPRSNSVLHGSSHWKRVAATGLVLLEDLLEEETPRQADPLVVFLFALFHDSQRLNDGYDPKHGARGAALARELAEPGDLHGDLHGDLYSVSDEQMDLLVLACVEHDGGHTSDDPTVGLCWDSDRLCLWRVGIRPRAALLSTRAARDPERIEWARGVVSSGIFRWEDLARSYGLPWGPDRHDR